MRSYATPRSYALPASKIDVYGTTGVCSLLPACGFVAWGGWRPPEAGVAACCYRIACNSFERGRGTATGVVRTQVVILNIQYVLYAVRVICSVVYENVSYNIYFEFICAP